MTKPVVIIENISIGELVSAKIIFDENAEGSDKKRWIDAIVIGKNKAQGSVDLVIINAKKHNILPLAYQVQIQDIVIDLSKEIKIVTKSVGQKIVAKEEEEEGINGKSKYKYPLYVETNIVCKSHLVDISSITKNPMVTILGKCEFFNPSYSVKDRIVKHILDCAEQNGDLKKGDTIVCASSGNTAASVAMFAACRGYKAMLITNTKCSQEKVNAIKSYGAEVLITKSGVPTDSPKHYMNMEISLCQEREDYFSVNQYKNPQNTEAHYNNLGPEIWNQTNGKVDYFVAGSSTGGTFAGTTKYLKEMNPKIKCILPDPKGSVIWKFVNEGVKVDKGKILVEGVGKDQIPALLNVNQVDECHVVDDQNSFNMCHILARKEGLLVGGSAGMNVYCAKKIADNLITDEPVTIVTILCDSGIKYLSKIYNEEWINQNGLTLLSQKWLEENDLTVEN